MANNNTNTKGQSTLAKYVKKTNGVALGANGSLSNMLLRSLGASSFHAFWRYWNPIWGYYLSRYVMKPLNLILPSWLALLFTFLVSGAIHDVAVSLIKSQLIVFLTPWFGLMGMLVVVSKYFSISYASFPWLARAIINAWLIASTFWLTVLIQRLT